MFGPGWHVIHSSWHCPLSEGRADGSHFTRVLRLPVLFLLACISIFALPAAAGQEAELRERFFSEAPEGWAALEAASTRLDALGTKADVAIEGGIAVDNVSRRTIHLKMNGDMQVFEVRYDDGEKDVYGVNRRYGFALEQQAERSPFIIRYLGDDLEAVRDEIPSSVPFHVPWKLSVVPFRELIAAPTFELLGIEGVERDGESLVKIRFTYEPYGPAVKAKTAIRGGWILFSPRRRWGLVESEIDAAWGGLMIHAVDYADDGPDGIPTVRQVVDKNCGKDRQRGAVRTTEFERWGYRDVPEEEFTLKSYGLPEVDEKGAAAGRSVLHYWLFGIGLAFAGIAIALRVYRS